jgi:hypothetical protein
MALDGGSGGRGRDLVGPSPEMKNLRERIPSFDRFFEVTTQFFWWAVPQQNHLNWLFRARAHQTVAVVAKTASRNRGRKQEV